MLRNYVIIALRHFWANKSYVIINVIGLAVCIVICILAYYHFAYNFEFNDVYRGSTHNIYRVEKFVTEEGKKNEHAMSSLPMIKLLMNDVPGVKQRIRYTSTYASGANVSHKVGDNYFKEDVFCADSGFFKAFKHTFIRGNESAFADISSIVLTERRAKKYYGNEDPIGKPFTLIYNNGKKKDLIVRAVIKDQPLNSSFQFGVLIRFENYLDVLDIDESDWKNWRQPEVYLEIPDDNTLALVNSQFAGYVKTYNEMSKDHPIDKITLLPFFEIAPHSREVNSSMTNGIITPSFVIMMGMVGLLVLLIACFNYTNTSIALASTRIKEISLRKVMGSQRKHIIWQFLLEHFIISLLAIFFALVLSDFFNPFYWNLWSDGEYSFNYISSKKYLSVFLVFILLFTTLISGAYPAFYISRLKTADALRRNLKLKGGNWFTYVLLAFQLIVTIVGLGMGIVFYENVKFIEKTKKGYSVENIIAVPMNNEKDMRNFDLYKSKIIDNPDILAIAGTSQHISWQSWMEKTQFNDKEIEATMLPTGEDYLQTMGVKMVEGRFFDKHNSDDTNCVIVNEKYIKAAGIVNPLNESIRFYSTKHKIIGVAGDFMQQGVSVKIKPMVITLVKKGISIVAIKTSPGKLDEVNKFLENKWKESFPDNPYYGYSQRRVIDTEIKEFNVMKTIFLFISAVSLILSLIGLYVLIALIINKKTKEIGIRKVMGSPVGNIIFVLGKNFLYIFGIAALVGSFFGLTFAKYMLDDLYRIDNHVDITPFTFMLCALVIALVAMLTIIYKVIKAANANPVVSLRNE